MYLWSEYVCVGLTSSGCPWGWFPGRTLWSGLQWRMAEGWSSESCWWLSAPPGRLSVTPFPRSTGTTRYRLQEHTDRNNSKWVRWLSPTVHNNRMTNNGWVSVEDLISTSGTELSAFLHSDVTALSQCRFKANASKDNCLPAPCFSSSAAELVTDCDEVSTMSSRGSLK